MEVKEQSKQLKLTSLFTLENEKLLKATSRSNPNSDT